MVDVIRTIDGLSAIEADWKRLENDRCMRIFQTYDWCRSAWEAYLSKCGGSLYVICWRRNEDKIVLPSYIDRKGILRFIADDDSDVCDAVYCGGSNHHVAYREIAKCIEGEPRIKGVWLQKLQPGSEAANYFGVLLPGAVVYRDNAFSWVRLAPPGGFVAAQTHMPSKDRADLKGLVRQAVKYPLKVFSSASGDAFPLEAVVSLRGAMRSSGRRPSNYLDDSRLDFMRRIYSFGLCDVAVLSADGAVVAANILLKKDGRVLSWIFLYTDPKASTLLYANCLAGPQAVGGDIFDFGVGVYGYKIGTFRPELSITLSLWYAKGVVRKVLAVLSADIRFLKDIVKSLRRKGGSS